MSMKSKFLVLGAMVALLFASCAQSEEPTGMEKMQVGNAVEVVTLTVPDTGIASAERVNIIVRTTLINNGVRQEVSTDTVKSVSPRPIYVSVLEGKKEDEKKKY